MDEVKWFNSFQAFDSVGGIAKYCAQNFGKLFGPNYTIMNKWIEMEEFSKYHGVIDISVNNGDNFFSKVELFSVEN